MQANAIDLAVNVSGTSQVAYTLNTGGRYVVVIHATTYDATCSLQVQLPSAQWVNVNGTAYSADGMYGGYDLPPGQYRMNLGSTTSGCYAKIVRVSY